MVTPNPLAVLPVVNLFTDPTGREYALAWWNGPEKSRHGYIRMTDFLFNYYFYPTAFGLDGAYNERTVSASSNVRMRREIGKPAITYARKAYTRKITPTFRTGAYDTGTQLFAVDGDDVWNFEIGGRLDEFRIWVNSVGNTANLKRTFEYRTITGVGATAVPITAALVP